MEQESDFKGKSGGTLTFTKKELVEVPLFVDYLRSGWTISFSCCIDYTGSNGNYTNPTSLHFNTGPLGSQYQQAIRGVGAVLQPYSTDKLFAIYGFGGIPKFMGES